MERTDDQARIDRFTPPTETVSITRTVPFNLETSNAKTDIVQEAIDEFQAMAEYAAAVAPSFGKWGWSPQNNAFYRRVTEEFDDRTVKATIARGAGQKVAEAFQSWRERGQPGHRPEFGDGDFMRLSHQDLTISQNDRGWGLKASFIPYNPVWFHIDDGEFQRRFLERITDDEDSASIGSGEMYLRDNGLECHVTVSWDVDVYEPGNVDTSVGVDIGENVLYAAAVVKDGDVQAVDMKSGREYRHHREQIKRSRKEASQQGDLRGVRDARHSYQKYTDHITNVASRRVVELAAEHRPSVIHIEDLTHYRETADDPIHDWPYAEIQEKIAYKAEEEGIPVAAVEPADTSTTCRKCDATHPASRNGSDFECMSCGYQVHADVNAAINIALQN